jgi:hypothetical protein
LFCKCGFNLRDTLGVGQPLERRRVLKINGKALHRSLPIEIVALLLINVPSSDRLSAYLQRPAPSAFFDMRSENIPQSIRAPRAAPGSPN